MSIDKNTIPVAIVTGASSGIGLETACALIQKGYCVYGLARRVALMQVLVESGGIACEVDITDELQLSACIAEIGEKHNRIDVLVNNAGYGTYGAVEEVSIEDAKAQFEVNVFALARITQLVLPYMRKNKYGRIIMLSSIAGKIYMPLAAWYFASKHAVEGFADCLRNEVYAYNIAVSVVEPGVIGTQWDASALDSLAHNSAHGAYSEMMYTVQTFLQRTYSTHISSSPLVVVKCIMHAVQSRRPKIRYVCGKYARLFLWCRQLLTDVQFDYIVRIAIRIL